MRLAKKSQALDFKIDLHAARVRAPPTMEVQPIPQDVGGEVPDHEVIPSKCFPGKTTFSAYPSAGVSIHSRGTDSPLRGPTAKAAGVGNLEGTVWG